MTADAVLLLSGGMDSTTMLGVLREDKANVLAVSFDYGQKHSAEISKAAIVARHYGVEHKVVQIPNVFGDESTVMKGGPHQPRKTYKEIAESVGPSPTVVPFRNANMISLATAIAVVEGATTVYAAVHAEDARGWAYPDCTPEFSGAMANAVRVGTYDKVRYFTPFQWAMKADIVRMGLAIDVPYNLTMSCYDGLEPACGECPTCVERLEAFKANDYPDPILYQA